MANSGWRQIRSSTRTPARRSRLRRLAGRRRRRQRMERRARRSPWSSFWVWMRLGLLVLILALIVVGAAYRHDGAVTPTQAFARGFQRVTFYRVTPDIWFDLIVLSIALVTIRSLSLRFLAFRANSPVEVRPIDNATLDPDLSTHRLDVAFRDYLALSRLYQIPTVPGDQQPDRLIEVLSTPASKGRLAVFSAALAYAFPRRAFVVTASLLERTQDDRRYGVSVQVRRYPKLPVHLETQWSKSFERALQRAAYAVSAHITQQTKACRRVPWSEWARRKQQLPTSLFRDYQRAKQMLGERRYDEALALYHSALRQDSDNIAMRYDVGQLYERLGLYPDALLTYLGLVDEIFPLGIGRNHAIPKPTIRGRSAPAEIKRHKRNRVPDPTWWPKPRARNRDPFVIRYRYVIVLGEGELLARELISPEWPERGKSIGRLPGQPALSDDKDLEQRPWRATELEEIGRLLSGRLDSLYSPYCGKSLTSLVGNGGARGDQEARKKEISQYLLTCAEYEASTLVRDIERIGRRLPGFWSRRTSFLTPTAARQAQLMIAGRRECLKRQHGGAMHVTTPDITTERLASAGYSADHSINWLEHYNAACHYALPILDDTEQRDEHRDFAYESVAALGRASRYGDRVDFVTSKKYWLQVGDPDLAGLRYYRSFRAFEARVYGHPLPAIADLSRYELFRFLRAVIRRAARHLEEEWRKRGERNLSEVSLSEFERWWRQELRAWEIAIRIGRFYHQWQTRYAALEAIREWFESFGLEALPIPYPNITRGDNVPNIGDYGLFEQMMVATEGILKYLGMECGYLVASSRISSRDGDLFMARDTVYDKTQIWSEHAAACSRSGRPLPTYGLADACLGRSAVWASLRQWAQSPDEGRQQILQDAIDSLTCPSGTSSR